MARRPGSHLRDAAELTGPAGLAGLPEDCPVIPLGGTADGCWYLNSNRQAVYREAGEHGMLRLLHLFGGRRDYLASIPAWQRRNKAGEVVGFAPELVAASLMRAAIARGPWNDAGKLRGRGAWRGEDGDLILHCGDRLWIAGRLVDPGLRGELVYQASDSRPRPADDAQPGGAAGPAAELFGLLKSWPWADPLSARLLLGWVCAAQVGGALPWRPAVWTTGDSGTGKSTLQELLKALFVQQQGIHSIADGSEAGLRQLQMHDTLPIALDELEADANPAKVNAVIKLVRLAASGGLIVRGGQDHRGQSFIARFCTLATSINVPSMLPQDRSRIAILELTDLQPGSRPPPVRMDDMRALGRRLLRRMADAWPGFEARWQQWRECMLADRMTARAADQYGTLLACADLALHDDAPTSEEIAEQLAALAGFLAPSRAIEVRDWQACLMHLTSSLATAWRQGEQRTLGSFVAQAAGQLPGHDNVDEAQHILATVGLRVVQDDGRWWLAVANLHAGLQRLFEGTRWTGLPGAPGVWASSLKRAPSAKPSSGPMRFRGYSARAVLIPVELALDAGQGHG